MIPFSWQTGWTDTQQKHTCEYTFTNRGKGYIGRAEGAMKAYTKEDFSIPGIKDNS